MIDLICKIDKRIDEADSITDMFNCLEVVQMVLDETGVSTPELEQYLSYKWDEVNRYYLPPSDQLDNQ